MLHEKKFTAGKHSGTHLGAGALVPHRRSAQRGRHAVNNLVIQGAQCPLRQRVHHDQNGLPFALCSLRARELSQKVALQLGRLIRACATGLAQLG